MLVTTPEQVQAVVSALAAHSGPIGLDTEYAGPSLKEKDGAAVDIQRAKLVGFSVALSEQQRWYLPVAHEVGAELNIGVEAYMVVWASLIEHPGPWVMHNAKADLRMMFRGNMCETPQIEYHDTVLLGWLLEKRLPGKAGLKLKSLAEAELGYSNLSTFEDLAAKRPADQIHPTELEPYAALDAWLTLALFHKWWPDMSEPLRKCYLEIELPLQRELMAMEDRGVQIDQAGLDTLAATVYQQGQDMAWEVFQLTGQRPTCHQAIGAELYGNGTWQEAGAPRTPKGRPSTGAKALEYQLQVLPEGTPGHQVAAQLLAHAAQQKLRTTYVPGLRRYSGPYADGRLRADYRQHGTDTGRFASSGPMLTLPARSAALTRVRELVVAGLGKELWVADYSQLEPRWMAHLAQDEKLLAGFAAGKSNYEILMGELGIDKPTAKVMWLGVSYGMGPYKLAQTLRMTKEAAQTLLEDFWRRFAGLRRYQEVAVAEARRTGYARTLLGRRRHLPDLHHQCGPETCPLNKWGKHQCGRRAAAERQAINTPIQGSAADTIKLAMLKYAGTYGQHSGRIILQVHDELLVEADQGDDLAGQLLTECMQNAVQLRCPLEAKAHRGASWAKAKP